MYRDIWRTSFTLVIIVYRACYKTMGTKST